MTSVRSSVLGPPQSVRDIEELLDQITDQISVWDHSRRLIHANAAVLTWAGRTLSDTRGVSFVDIVGVDVAEHLEPYFLAAETGEAVHYARQLVGSDGMQYSLMVRVSAVVIRGRVLGYVMVGTDRTAVVGAQQSQREAAERVLLLGERDRVAAELNDQVLSRLRTISPAPGRTGRVAAPPLTAASVPELDEVVSVIRQAIAGLRKPVSPDITGAVAQVPRGASSPTWNPSLPTAADESAATSSWTFDEALAFVDEMPAISVWDAELICCFANRLAVRGVGLDSRTSMIGLGRIELFGPEVAARGLPYAQAAVGGDIQRYDSDFVDGEGIRRRVHFVYYPVCRDGRPIGVIALLHDEDPAEQVSESAARLAALNADRLRIAEDLHDHVIQNIYAAGLALDSEISADGASRSSEHAAMCIAAAIEALQASVHDLHLDPGTEVAESIDRTVHRAAPALGFEPQLDVIGDVNQIVPRIAEELLAVLTEALSNVARHAHATGVHITLSASMNAVWLRVADDGVGISGSTRSSGLSNMANRAQRLGGILRHTPNTPHGTVVDWQVPT